jgi:mannosyltransferase OCH1-like enzyme
MPEKYMNTWRDMNPEWEHIVWNDEKIAEKYPNGFRNQSKIEEIEEWAGKADIMRYEILLDFGGIYIDADSICTNSLDDHFLKHDSFACFENEQCRGNLIANGYLGSIKNSNLMKILVEKISKMKSVSHAKTGKMAWQCVGPLFFTETVMESNYPLSVYPSFVFIPEHYSLIIYQGTRKSYSKQLWGSTQEFKDPEYYNKL